WKDVGYQGSEGQTPNIDRLCREGVRLERLYAFPLCSPTRSALMTGRNPVRFGLGYTVVRPWSTYGLPQSETTMAEVFRSAGYQTAVIGKWHLGHANVAQLPKSRGFDYFYGHLNGAIDYFKHDRDGGIDWQRDGVSVRETGYSTDLLAAAAARWIAGREKQKPFFLYVPWNAPHGPLQAPPDLMAKYSSVKDTKRQTFLAIVDALDRGVGTIVKCLEGENIASNTLVIFMSDNGGARPVGADNGPLRSGKSNVFEGGIRVPGVAWWPGKLKPGVCSQMMTAYDMLPTLTAACSVPCKTKQPLDGMNFWQAVSQGSLPVPRQNLLFAVQPDRGPRQHALRDGPWKLVRIGQAPSDQLREMLFNVEEDPNEQKDLLASQPEVAARLRRMMEDWIRLVPPGEASYSLDPHPGWVTPKDWAKVAVE
ncbi:MAG: arylsulfatase, partial [Bryobacteraceae bacterium]|nr:arylsulfatase [Bryobacteraceae bacterium]